MNYSEQTCLKTPKEHSIKNVKQKNNKNSTYQENTASQHRQRVERDKELIIIYSFIKKGNRLQLYSC